MLTSYYAITACQGFDVFIAILLGFIYVSVNYSLTRKFFFLSLYSKIVMMLREILYLSTPTDAALTVNR
jgi:hypothetical protein